MRESQTGGSRNGGISEGARLSLIFVAVVALALFVWKIATVLLLAFVGVLFAVFLRGLAQRLSDHSPLSASWALAVVALTIVAVLAALVLLMGPRISDQVQQLAETLPQSIGQLQQTVQETELGAYVLQQMQTSNGGLSLGSNVFSQLSGTASRVVGGVMDVVLILFAAIFFAINPRLYKRGVSLLLPKGKEGRFEDALDATGDALWKWLMGKIVAMLFVGVAVTVGLSLLGIPLALTLGILAGLFDFIPFFGPIVAAVPGVLLGLTVGPSDALYAALVYFAAQQIEGNVLTPLVQRRAVSVPPVLVLFAVIAGGLLFGVLGMLVATPLVVVAMVMISMLYVEDTLGKNVTVPGK